MRQQIHDVQDILATEEFKYGVELVHPGADPALGHHAPS